MITCRDVYNLRLDGVELLTGEVGLERMVSWTYMVQTKPFDDHMNPGNFALIVIDYVRFTLDLVPEIMDELNDLGIPAIAANTKIINASMISSESGKAWSADSRFYMYILSADDYLNLGGTAVIFALSILIYT